MGNIISASRRTDIPAFYSEWFINRIRAGSFMKVNPYNHKQRSLVSLLPSDVAAIVFWTKNPQPLMVYLPEMDTCGYRYLFHFTLNDYSKVIEPQVPALEKRIRTFKWLSETIGPEKIIWRYDPIIISNFDSVEAHLERFGRIAEMLKGYTQRVMISLVAMYEKTLANFKRITPDHALQITDIRADEQRKRLYFLGNGLSSIAKECGLAIYSCSEKLDLRACNIQPGSCIDVKLMNNIFSMGLKEAKDKFQRPECGCAPSVDMGFYDTCGFGCIYCYANTSSRTMLHRTVRHDPSSESLILP